MSIYDTPLIAYGHVGSFWMMIRERDSCGDLLELISLREGDLYGKDFPAWLDVRNIFVTGLGI